MPLILVSPYMVKQSLADDTFFQFSPRLLIAGSDPSNGGVFLLSSSALKISGGDPVNGSVVMQGSTSLNLRGQAPR